MFELCIMALGSASFTALSLGCEAMDPEDLKFSGASGDLVLLTGSSQPVARSLLS